MPATPHEKQRLKKANRPVFTPPNFTNYRRQPKVNLNALPQERLQAEALHPEKGPMTPTAMAELMVRHSAHHIAQLLAIRDGREWKRA